MRSTLVLAATLLVAAPIVNAQDGRARQRWPDSTSQQPQREQAPRPAEPRSAPQAESQPREQSRPREESQAREQSRPREAQPRERAPRSTDQASQPQAARPQAQDDRRRATSRDRDNGAVVGRAVPRQGPPPQTRGRDRDDWRDGGRSYNGRRVYVYPHTTVFGYYDYPRRYYPFGYGGYGPGYYYYRDNFWYPYSAYDDPYRFNPYRYGYPTGEVRLDIRETFAEVWVDGYYAGTVDDFDGIFQGLTLEEGIYNIEVVAPGYEPLEFDIRIDAGRKITYRGDLRRARQGSRY